MPRCCTRPVPRAGLCVGQNRPVDISAKTDYAIRALLALAERPGGPVSVEALASAQTLPKKFLEAILSDLRRAGIVTSLRRVLDETSLEQLRTGALPEHVRELATDPGAWQNR